MKIQILLFLSIIFLLNSCSSDDSNTNNDNDKPVIANQTFSIEEGSLNLTEIGQIVATDPQNLTLSYTLVSESVNGAFNLDGQTGMLSINEEFPYDYETNSNITANVKVSNGTLENTATITVNILDLDYPNSGLRAFYQMDSDTNAIATDLIGNYSGDIIGNVSLSADRHDVANGAYDFQGGRIKVGPSVLNGLTNFTIMGWFNNSNASGVQSIFIKSSPDIIDIQLIKGSTNNGLILRYSDPVTGSNNDANLAAEALIGANSWSHFAVKVENNKIWSLYIDGQLIKSTTFIESNTWSSNDGNLNIGAHGSGTPWKGKLDDFMVYERLLRDIEIAAMAKDNY